MPRKAVSQPTLELVVPSFAGGVAFDKHPAHLADYEWSWADGFLAKDGCAEVMIGYEKISDGAWLPAGHSPLGLAQNPFSFTDAAVLVTHTSNVPPPATNAPQLFKMKDSGAATAIPWDGVGTAPQSSQPSGHVGQFAFFQTGLAVLFGHNAGAPGLGFWTGGATYAAVNTPSTPPQGVYLVAFGGHLLILARTFSSFDAAREILISDINLVTGWDPADSNSAEDVFLAEASTPITAAGLGDGNGVIAFSRNGRWLLSPTGQQAAPFIITYIDSQGCEDLLNKTSVYPIWGGFCGTTPYGLFYHGTDDFYLRNRGVGRKVYAYWHRDAANVNIQAILREFVWHSRRGYLVVGVPPGQTWDGATATAGALLFFDPVASTWSRRTLPLLNSVALGGAISFTRHAYIIDNHANTTAATIGRGRHWLLASDGQVYVERWDEAATGGEYVDTKDFALSSPNVDDQLLRIKVDWEPLTNASTDALDILTWSHNDLAPGVLGSTGLDTGATATFTLQATLTGGVSETDVRPEPARYVRLRFKQRSGRFRLRGFTLIFRRGGSRRAPATAS